MESQLYEQIVEALEQIAYSLTAGIKDASTLNEMAPLSEGILHLAI
jgi:hypothetical protein